MNQVLHGITTLKSHGLRDGGSPVEATAAIDQAREHIAVHADRVAKEVVEELRARLKVREEEYTKLQTEHQSLCAKLKTRY